MGHETRTSRRAWLAAAVALALAVVGTAPSASGERAVVDRQTQTFALGDGRRWSVVADVATVQVAGDAARRDVRIDIVRRAATAQDLARLPVVVRETDAGPEVIVRQSDGGLDATLRAEVVVSVPTTGTRGDVSIVEGGLELRGFEGQLSARVTRGPIAAVNVSGVLRLETTIGAVDVSGARLAPGGLLRLRAFNGDVRLGFAEVPRDARIMALALNGSVQSAIPLTTKDGWGPRWGEATLGAGEPVVSIDVVTGRIRIEAPARR